MVRKPTDEVQLKLRFSESLRRRLERAAARNNRSMNTEIIHRLERSFADETRSEMTSKDHQLAQQVSTTTIEQFIVKLIDPASGPDVIKRLSEQITVEPKTKGEGK